MKDYLRPSTLYKEENFQSYLNQLECKFCSKRGHTAEIETDCPYYVSEQT